MAQAPEMRGPSPQELVRWSLKNLQGLPQVVELTRGANYKKGTGCALSLLQPGANKLTTASGGISADVALVLPAAQIDKVFRKQRPAMLTPFGAAEEAGIIPCGRARVKFTRTCQEFPHR